MKKMLTKIKIYGILGPWIKRYKRKQHERSSDGK